MQYKRPESVLVLVYTQASEVLMLRDVSIRMTFGSRLRAVLRRMRAPMQAAIRELHEETGISLEKNYMIVSFPKILRFMPFGETAMRQV